jgi:AraC-like DNA-binding protein
MQAHICQPLALGEIAREAGLSVSHFCALFRTQIGVTPMDYFIKLKLQKARRLLVNSALTVQEVAQQVGYGDRYYFSRLFRKLHGVPPMAYRRSQRSPA